MSTYRATYYTTLSIEVELEATDEDAAADKSHEIANDYLLTLGTQRGDSRIVMVDASLDGIGADAVEDVS